MASNEAESTLPPLPQETTSDKNQRGKTDPSWGHCKEIIEENGKKALECLYCNKKVRGGGINRFKAHLAGEKGQVEACKKVPGDIRFQMKQNIDGNKSKKRKVQEEYNDSNPLEEGSVGQEAPPSKNSTSEKRKSVIGSYFAPRTTLGAQPTLKSVLQSKEAKEKCDLAISKWMIDAGIPFNAVNSTYFQPMIDAICSMGPGYKAPNFHKVRGPLLSKWVEDVGKLVDSYRTIWKETGCTIMADGWIDHCRRTLINFLVYCPQGTIFVKSVDASHVSKTAEMLYKLFREVVLFVGPENVVQIMTDNAANYVAAGRLLEAEFPKIFWSHCAAHCINLMLYDIGKLEEVSEKVVHASKITKYIYNHCHALHLMRKHTGGREILQSVLTRFATNFIALQSILSQKDALRDMVTSREWTSQPYAKDIKAKDFVEQVLNFEFWKKCAKVVKLTEPLVCDLRLVDSEAKPTMSFLYQAIFKAREEMVRRFQRNKKKVEPYLNILDNRWDSQLRKNLHAAGYWLNPGCRFNAEEFEKHKFTTSGLLDVIERYAHGDYNLQSNLTSEMRLYKGAQMDFGRPSAIRERTIVMPDQWWELYGCGAPNLQKLAIRILSQTCSASGCERNWSAFEHIHSKKRNRLEHQKLNDLVYVRYNIRLQQRHQREQNFDPINLETIVDHTNWVFEDSPPLLTPQEVHALQNDLVSVPIEPTPNDNDQLNLDDDGDDDDHGNEAPNNTSSNANQIEENAMDNVDPFEDTGHPNYFDDDREPFIDAPPLDSWP